MKKPKQQQSFENSITSASLAIAAVPFILLLIFLVLADISFYLKIIISLFTFVVIAIGNLLIWRKLTGQLRTTTNIVEALITGDSTMKPSSAIQSGALKELNQVINTASEQLAEQRLLSKEHHIAMSKVLEHINVAVICFDENAVVTLLNPKAKHLFSVHDEMLGMPARSLGIEKSLLNVKQQKVVTLKTEQFEKRVFLQTDTYQLHRKTYTLLFLNDVQKLLQNEERVAWQRLLRVLSHEINNSLAPIASIGESLTVLIIKEAESSSNGQIQQDLIDGLHIMTQRALALDSFIKEYQALTRLPQPQKSLFSLQELIVEHTELFPEIEFEVPEKDFEVYADRTQLSQVLVNLLKNAKQALLPSENKCFVKIDWYISHDQLQLNIVDNGRGISNPDNLFVPFYTTKAKGSGIGLVLSRQILFNHGGDLSLRNNQTHALNKDGDNSNSATGACAILTLPIVLK